MFRSSILLPIATLTGVLCLGFGVFLLFRQPTVPPTSPQSTPATQPTDNRDHNIVTVSSANSAGVKALTIKPGDELDITATGTVDIGRGPVGPSGESNYFDYTMDGPFAHHVGGLEMWVGNKGHRYFVGNHLRQKFQEGGDVYFRVVESVYGYTDGNKGQFTVTVKKVNASTFQVLATEKWKDTGIEVTKGQRLQISATGSVIWDQTFPAVGPNGTFPANTVENPSDFPIPSAGCGSLVMKIGSAVYAVGESDIITVSESGPILFMVNDRFNYLFNNSGSFNVKVEFLK